MSLDNHHTVWTREELAFVAENWDGHRDTTEVIADLLGRTPDAVQQRYYELTWGNDHAMDEKPETNEREGSHHPDQRWGTEICGGCFMQLPATGVCDFCQ